MEKFEEIERSNKLQNLFYWLMLPERERIARIKVVIKEDNADEIIKSDQLS